MGDSGLRPCCTSRYENSEATHIAEIVADDDMNELTKPPEFEGHVFEEQEPSRAVASEFRPEWKQLQDRTQLRLDFEFKGQSRSVVFTMAPLGLIFKVQDQLRVNVVRPGSHAAELGVESGWAILQIDGEDVTDKDLKYVMEKIANLSKAAILEENLPSLKIDFESREGEKKACVFTKTPIGLVFNVRDRLLVDMVDPDSHASMLGVQRGWELKQVVGHDMTGSSWPEVVKKIKTLTEFFPTQAVVERSLTGSLTGASRG